MVGSGWWLFALIVGPLVITALPIAVIVHKRLQRKTEFQQPIWRVFALNPDFGLASQALFWLAICAPILYFCVFGVLAWYGHSVLLTGQGFSNFWDLSKLPFALLSLSIPVTALVAKLHSTAQTAKQIGLTSNQIELASRQVQAVENKNNHDLFYTHRKEFVTFYDLTGEINWLDEYTTSYKIDPRIHAKLFVGEPAEGLPRLNVEVMDNAIRDLRWAESFLANLINSYDLDEAEDRFTKYSIHIKRLIDLLGLSELSKQIKLNGIYFTHHGEDRIERPHYYAGTSTRQAVAIYRCVKSYLQSAAEFAGYREGVATLKSSTLEFINENDDYKTMNPTGLVVEKLVRLHRLNLSDQEFEDGFSR